MAKKYDIHETPFGLCSDPNVLKAPQGALKECINCNIKRDSIIEPRTGMDAVDLSSSALTNVNRIFNFDGDLLMWSGTDDYFEFLGNLGTELTDEDSGHPTFFTNHHSVQRARENLYVPCTDGVRKITGSDSTDIFKAGLTHDVVIEALQPTAATSAPYNWLANNDYVGYRITLQREDANNVVVESPPSNVVAVQNTTGTARGLVVTIGFSNYVQADDVVRVFRTVTNSVGFEALGDSFYLAHERTVTASDVSSGGFLFSDGVSDDDLEESLYTNPENEGLLNRNDQPPVSKCISSYKGSMFYSNVIEPSRVIFRIKNEYNDLEGESDGAGIRTSSCTVSNGSPNITGIADDTGLEVGQLVDGTYIPDNTYLIAVTGGGAGTATMSKNATGSSTADRDFIDTITFGYDSTYETTMCEDSLGGGWSAQGLVRQMIDATGDHSSDEYVPEILDSVFRNTNTWNTVKVVRRTLNSSTFYVWATHGESYDPELSGPTYSGGFVFSVGNGLQSDMLVKPNREYWSKNNQPEHVPLVNWHDIGDGSAIIQAVETKDGRLVFKANGDVYSVTGEGARSGWSVRLVASGHTLVAPDAIVRVGDAVYALTLDGLVKATIYGVERISRLYINYNETSTPGSGVDESLATVLREINYRYKNESSILGAFVTHDKSNNQILFTIPPTYTTDTKVFVYNLDTHRFTTWDFGNVSIQYILSNESDYNKLYYAGSVGETGYLYEASIYYGGDDYRFRTIDSTPDSTTINFTADHNAYVGDHIVTGAYRAIISAIIDSDSVTVDTIEGMSGGVIIFTPIVSTIRWMPRFGETRALKKNFVAYSFMFDSLTTKSGTGVLGSYKASFQSGGSEYGSYDIAGKSVRRLVPVAEARTYSMEPAIIIESVNVLWSLAGMSLEYFLQAPRGTK